MKRISILAVTACCVLALALAGCAGGDHKTDTDSLKGFWVLDTDATPMGFDAAMSLDDNNYADLSIGDTYLEGSWTADGKQATLKFDGEQPVSLYVTGDKLVYGSDNGSKLIFKKSEEDEYYEGLESAGGILQSASSAEAPSVGDVEIVDEVINDITPVTVADDAKVKIEVTGKGTDFIKDPGYRVVVTNKSDKAFFLTFDEAWKVDGKPIEPGIGDVVEAGDTVETFIFFSQENLPGGIDALKAVEGKIIVADDASGETIGTYDFKMD